MKKILLLLSLFSVTGFAQTNSLKKSPHLTEGCPESVGVSVERLAKIDSMCRDAISRGILPGLVALVAKDGKIIFHEAYGMADNTSQRHLKKNDIFRIASQTKAITATAVMMLWEEGKFRLDDPISGFIPEFKNPQVLDTLFADGTYLTKPAEQEITIRHLLTHTSGIGYGVIDRDKRFKRIYKDAGIIDLFTTQHITIEENIKKLAQLPLHHKPGEKYVYSEGLDVLGYLIEIVSGRPLDQFFKERIFTPLEMNDTWFYLPEDKQSRLVSLQKRKNNTWIKYPVTFYDPDYPVKGAKTYFSGGAGLCSTAKDYASFLQMYLNGGELNGKRLLSRTTIKTILSNQTGDLFGVGEYHGLAFGVVNEKGQRLGGRGSIGTFDWGGYFNTQYFADPKENIIGIILKQTQDTPDDATEWKFRQMVFQTLDN